MWGSIVLFLAFRTSAKLREKNPIHNHGTALMAKGSFTGPIDSVFLMPENMGVSPTWIQEGVKEGDLTYRTNAYLHMKALTLESISRCHRRVLGTEWNVFPSVPGL